MLLWTAMAWLDCTAASKVVLEVRKRTDSCGGTLISVVPLTAYGRHAPQHAGLKPATCQLVDATPTTREKSSWADVLLKEQRRAVRDMGERCASADSEVQLDEEAMLLE